MNRLKVQKAKINGIGKSMLERKKNPYDPVAHPSLFMRGRNESEKSITLDGMVKTIVGKKAEFDITVSKTKPSTRPLSANLGNVKKTEIINPVLETPISSGWDDDLPYLFGTTPEDYRNHKRQMIDLVIERQIYKFSELKDLFERLCNKNSHLERNKLMEIFEQINDELDK